MGLVVESASRPYPGRTLESYCFCLSAYRPCVNTIYMPFLLIFELFVIKITGSLSLTALLLFLLFTVFSEPSGLLRLKISGLFG